MRFLPILLLACGPTLGDDLDPAIPPHPHPAAALDTARSVQAKTEQIAEMLCQEHPTSPECLELDALRRQQQP